MSENNPFNTESPPNFEEKSICCFVLDTSSSMQHDDAIGELNQGLQQFYQDITQDEMLTNRLEVAVVTFDSEIEVVVPPSLVDNFTMPTLSIKGNTRLVDGARKAIEMVEDRKDWYKQTGQKYLRPWIVLITDGAPNGDQDVKGLADEIQTGSETKKFVFLPIGVKNADMSVLNQIAGSISGKQVGPMKIGGLRFKEFFKWVSASMHIIPSSQAGDSIDLPNPNEWMDGFTVE